LARYELERCQVHKLRNVLDHLPEEEHAWVRHKIASAWSEPDAGKAEAELKALASALEKDRPGAAASLREGLEETVTINRFMLSAALRRTLRSTNPIESAIEIAKTTARRVKRWRNGEQGLEVDGSRFQGSGNPVQARRRPSRVEPPSEGFSRRYPRRQRE